MDLTIILFLVPPNYINSTGDQEISIGNGFSVIFNLEAQPIMGDNFTYTWTKNGVPFTSSSNVAITATSLSITSAECSDNGLYSVTATNPLGSDSVSFRLTVLCKLQLHQKIYYMKYTLCLLNLKALQHLKQAVVLYHSV